MTPIPTPLAPPLSAPLSCGLVDDDATALRSVDDRRVEDLDIAVDRVDLLDILEQPPRGLAVTHRECGQRLATILDRHGSPPWGRLRDVTRTLGLGCVERQRRSWQSVDRSPLRKSTPRQRRQVAVSRRTADAPAPQERRLADTRSSSKRTMAAVKCGWILRDVETCS